MTAESTLDAPEWRERREPGLFRSLALAFAVHAVLIAVMFVGVRWQNYHPETVEVELWEPPPPEPAVEAPKPPPPKAEPEPVKPEPKPQKPPEIAIREKAKPKPKPEPKKSAETKKQPPKRDLEFERQIREQAALEEKVLDEQRRIAEAQRQDKQLRELLARQQADARSRSLAGWTDKIRAKIRGNIPTTAIEGVAPNAEAVFDVVQLPTGEVLSVRLRKSSGFKAYDDAVDRAIWKSSPLPKPDQANLFERQLELRFRPRDQ